MDTNRHELAERADEEAGKVGVRACGVTRAEDARRAEALALVFAYLCVFAFIRV